MLFRELILLFHNISKLILHTHTDITNTRSIIELLVHCNTVPSFLVHVFKKDCNNKFAVCSNAFS